MPNVNIFVPQGSFHRANAGVSIGTDGCNTCVGLVAVLPDGSRRCAHFDSALVGRPDEIETIKTQALQMLRTRIGDPRPDPIQFLACTTSNMAKQSTGAICAAINEYLPGAEIVARAGVYVTQDNVIGSVTANEYVESANHAVENDHANII